MKARTWNELRQGFDPAFLFAAIQLAVNPKEKMVIY